VYSNALMHGTLSHPSSTPTAPTSVRIEPSVPAPAPLSIAPTPASSAAPAAPAARIGRPSNGSRSQIVRVAVVGATGYAGGEVVRLLANHPSVRIVGLVGREGTDAPLAARQPHLASAGLSVGDRLPSGVDAVFLALHHGAAVSMVPSILDSGAAVVDLGADFRLHDAADYPTWYGFDHPRPDLLGAAIYGLPELHRTELANADRHGAIVAAPGCYPTAAILAVAPLARAGLVDDLVVDAKSGVSGAGREPKPDLTFSEVNESVKAYGVGGHRHVAEMEQELALRPIEFVPHLVPMTRGILASCHVRTTRPVDQSDLDAIYAAAYEDEPFVRVVGEPPATKHVLASNEARVHVRLQPRTGRVLAMAAIDNLVKGAAGQAIQAFNVLFGLPETAGLSALPVAP